MISNKYTFIEMIDKIGAANSRIRLDYSFSIVTPGNYSYSAKQMAISSLLHLIITDCIKPHMCQVHCEPYEISKDKCLLQWDSCVSGSGYSMEGVFYFEIVGPIKFLVDIDDDRKLQRFQKGNLHRAISLIMDNYLTDDLQRKKEFKTQKEAMHHFKRTYPNVSVPHHVLEGLFNCIINDDVCS